MALFFLHTSAVFIECVLSFHPHLVLLIWPVCVSRKKSSARMRRRAGMCVCVCMCVCYGVCVSRALCVRDGVRMHQGQHVLALLPIWGKSVAHTSNVTQAKTTWLSHAIPERCKRGQRGLFWSRGPSRKNKNKQGLSQVMCSCIIKPKERGSASTCVGARNSRKCWILKETAVIYTSSPCTPSLLAILEQTAFFFFWLCFFLKLWEKNGLHWLALCEQSIFTNSLDPSSLR